MILTTRPGLFLIFLSITLISIIISFIFSKTRYKGYKGQLLIPVIFILLSIIFYIVTSFLPERGIVGVKVIPNLLLYSLFVLNIYLLIRTLKTVSKENPVNWKRYDLVFKYVLLLIAFLISLNYIGYYLSSFFFLFISMYILTYRNYKVMLILSSAWVAFSYFIFYKAIYIPLPTGKLFDYIF